MKFSKRCEYGIRAAVRLARSYGQGYIQSREIALSEDLPAKFLESILLALRSGGILESKVGAGGGYRLSRPPQEIRVRELLDTLIGEDPEKCEPMNPAGVRIGQHGMNVIVERMNELIEREVGEMTLAEVLTLAEERAGGGAPTMYYI